eukprot:gene14065-15531_t
MPKHNKIGAEINLKRYKHLLEEGKTPGMEEHRAENGNETLLESIDKWKVISQPLGAVSRWKNYACSRRKIAGSRKTLQKSKYRVGPAPKDDNRRKTTLDGINLTHQGIDCDLLYESEDDEANVDSFSTSPSEKASAKNITSKTTSRTLIIYFSKLSSGPKVEDVDLDFVEKLIKKGADINVTDKHGQTLLHEVSRTWHTDVAKFLIENNADINKGDRYGRTPLHVAAAVDYAEMVEFLVKNGASIHARTTGEYQTPTHYAAKNDACSSLKMLLSLGCNVHDIDYKNRTPLQVAAELDRSETAQYLVDQGVPVGVCDSSGLPALTLMIQKMPLIAKEALNQFHTTDRANRKQCFYLNYLETKHAGKDSSRAKMPMECATEFHHLDLLMHPVFRKLIEVKWNQFGQKRCLIQVVTQFLFVVIWTIVGVTLPRNRKYYEPISTRWWNVTLESIAVVWTIYYIFIEFWEYKSSFLSNTKWKEWRGKELERDLRFCHPRWPEEKKYLQQEIKEVNTTTISYFKDAWNYFDWITYACIITVILSRIVAVAWPSSKAKNLHPIFMAVALIFIWLRLMKVLRTFQALGPFIVMIGHIVDDTLKFLFLYIQVFIPFVCAFWILFGGDENAALMKAAGQPVESWQKFNDLVYTVSQITVVGDFAFDSITAIDRLTAQLLVGVFIAISGIVMINLFIALMSDTFQRVYDNAKANAVMQQASAILDAEAKLGNRSRNSFRKHIYMNCSPLTDYYDDDDSVEGGVMEKMTFQIKDIVDDIDENIKYAFKEGGMQKSIKKELEEVTNATTKSMKKQERTIKQMDRKINELTTLVNELLNRTAPEANRLANLPPPYMLSSSFREMQGGEEVETASQRKKSSQSADEKKRQSED